MTKKLALRIRLRYVLMLLIKKSLQHGSHILTSQQRSMKQAFM